jgi:hypothetical protein
MLSRLRIDATILLLLPQIPPFKMTNAMRKCRPSETAKYECEKKNRPQGQE